MDKRRLYVVEIKGIDAWEATCICHSKRALGRQELRWHKKDYPESKFRLTVYIPEEDK